MRDGPSSRLTDNHPFPYTEFTQICLARVKKRKLTNVPLSGQRDSCVQGEAPTGNDVRVSCFVTVVDSRSLHWSDVDLVR